MKKLILTIIMTLVALSTTACSLVYGQDRYDPDNYGPTYADDFAYLDRYDLVEWTNPRYDLQYSFYNRENVYLVIYGNRIYIIPYEYFWHYIAPHFRGRIIWRSYDYLCGYWGWHYYNRLWNHWYYRHHRSYWQPNYDYYYHHRNNNYNNRIIIRKNELKQRPDAIRHRINPQPNTNTGFRYRSNDSTSERRQIPHFTPRNDRPQIEIHRNTTPPPVKDNERATAREKN